jgi:hypothetical protein
MGKQISVCERDPFGDLLPTSVLFWRNELAALSEMRFAPELPVIPEDNEE